MRYFAAILIRLPSRSTQQEQDDGLAASSGVLDGKRVAEVDNRRALPSTSQYRRHVLKARDDLLDLSRITSGKVELDNRSK